MVTHIREDLITVEEFEELADWLRGTGRQYELIDGKIVKKMPSTDTNSDIICILAGFIQMHLLNHHLPEVFAKLVS